MTTTLGWAESPSTFELSAFDRQEQPPLPLPDHDSISFATVYFLTTSGFIYPISISPQASPILPSQASITHSSHDTASQLYPF
jgi:hypothetical protein